MLHNIIIIFVRLASNQAGDRNVLGSRKIVGLVVKGRLTMIRLLHGDYVD